MEGDSISMLLVIILLVSLSAFFSATETAYSSFNKLKIKSMVADDPRAELVLKIDDKFDKFITTILIGNNIVNITLTTVSTLFFINLLYRFNENTAATISTAIITVVVLIFGEITPKTLAKDHADGYVLATCGVVRFLLVILTPITWIFSQWKALLNLIFKPKEAGATTEDELITMVEEAEQDGGLDEDESELIRSAIEFSDMTVGEILTPRIDIVAVAENADFREAMMLFFETGYSRLPVIGDSIDDIVGVLHEKDFFFAYNSGKPDFKDYIKKPLFVSKHHKIDELLRDFQKDKCHMAFVIDEFGGIMGIVTMEDIIEELIGEVWDEHDEVETLYAPNDDGSVTVDGVASLDDIFEIFDLEFDEEDGEKPQTLNGWLQLKFEGLPEVDEILEYDGIEFKIISCDDKMINTVIVRNIREELEKREEEEKKNRSSSLLSSAKTK